MTRERYLEHARNLLFELGFEGEEVELQAPAVATYLETYVVAEARTKHSLLVASVQSAGEEHKSIKSPGLSRANARV